MRPTAHADLIILAGLRRRLALRGDLHVLFLQRAEHIGSREAAGSQANGIEPQAHRYFRSPDDDVSHAGTRLMASRT
jgi:hypothetical protein